jgi:hypothetical protein
VVTEMGYFSNGSEGEMYMHNYCFKCINWKEDNYGIGCPVWDLHINWSYELCNKKENEGKQMLDILIPIKGCQNQQCQMFIEKGRDTNED